MVDLPTEVRIRDVVLTRIDEGGDDIAVWSGDLPRGEHAMLSIVSEPAGPPTQESLDTADGVLERFDELVEAAIEFLVAELPTGGLPLLDADRERLATAPAPFALPEATVWSDGTWLLRFADADLEVAGDLGLAVRFVGTAPVDVEDLSDEDPDPDLE